MKKLIILLVTLAPVVTYAQLGKAKTTKTTFSRTTNIDQNISASPEKVWKLLQNAEAMPGWTTTVISVKGKIQVGEKIELVSSLDPERTFKLKVKEIEPKEKLVWGDNLGERTYTIRMVGMATQFSMTEKIGGFMFPLFASKIPSFDQSFEKFTADLKAKAEAGS
jgi:uncharacterized protein YndB with AHSA1/START domain